MKTAHRLFGVRAALGGFLLTGTLLPLALPAAHAEQVVPAIPKNAWFNDDRAPGAPPEPELTSGVPAKELPVEFKGAQDRRDPGTPSDASDDDIIARPNKQTFLLFDVSPIPAGSFVDAFTVVMPLGKGRQEQLPSVVIPGQRPVGGQPAVIACLAKKDFKEGEGLPLEDAPETDCTDAVFGEFDAKTKRYTFDMTIFAQDWVDGKVPNFGIALRPDEGQPANQPFQVTFAPVDQIETEALYSLPEPELPPVTIDLTPTTTTAASGSSGGSGGSTTTGGGSSTTTTTTTTGSGTGTATGPGTTGTGAVTGVTRTAVQPPRAAATPTRRAAAPQTALPLQPRAATPESTAPTVMFWVALAAGAAMLAAASLVAGDTRVPVSAGQSGGSRLSRQLQTYGRPGTPAFRR